jgi:hypothetical protein
VYDEKCLLRGTDWVFKYSSLCLVYDEKCLLRGTDWVFKYSRLCSVYNEKCLLRGTDWVFEYSCLCLVYDKSVYCSVRTHYDKRASINTAVHSSVTRRMRER